MLYPRRDGERFVMSTHDLLSAFTTDQGLLSIYLASGKEAE
jgi:hypothetical protein